MMRQDIKNKEFRGNQKYVSPSVKVIEVAAQRVLCGSGDINGFNVLEDDSDNWSNPSEE